MIKNPKPNNKHGNSKYFSIFAAVFVWNAKQRSAHHIVKIITIAWNEMPKLWCIYSVCASFPQKTRLHRLHFIWNIIFAVLFTAQFVLYFHMDISGGKKEIQKWINRFLLVCISINHILHDIVSLFYLSFMFLFV